MLKSQNNTSDNNSIVVKFVGDSGDGMQLAGTLFSNAAALYGLDLATFPDYPAEIRAPHNTIAGVSGFQVHVGDKKIETTGDQCDVLVAMNPASLKANLQWAKKGSTLIVDEDAFTESALEKSGYNENPLCNNSLSSYNIVKAPITTLTKQAVSEVEGVERVNDKSKNMFALGLLFSMFGWKEDIVYSFFENKFKKDQVLVSINKKVFSAGLIYGEAIEAIASVFQVHKAELKPGKYRNITGNVATAWGLLAASEKSGRPLFLGSYPITPATEILIELAKHKSLGAKVFQAEDEIAGICSAIGASYTGSLALTTTSGPGLSLKSEAIGLAVITELPLVIVDVQRGGPSTGLPTKSEQSDLYQALFGRNGECPLIVIAASSSANCFDYAYMAAKLAMEHMTPVILLTDGYLGNGSQLFRIPKVADMPAINPPLAQPNDPEYAPYARNPETLARKWAIPGTEGLRHRVGGLEKENIKGNVSTDPINHQKMVNLRYEKVMRVANYIPEQIISGDNDGDLLIVSWGSTLGFVNEAVEEVRKSGKKISHTHFNYIMPLPKNTEKVFKGFKNILVCELNSGQFVNYLRMQLPQYQYKQFNKVQGLPFKVAELTEEFYKILDNK